MVKYNKGDPTETGVYACRIPSIHAPDSGLLQDIFLMWYHEHWWNLGSDQGYRGEVLGWVGPLQRKMED